jgi:hypothetical protein
MPVFGQAYLHHGDIMNRSENIKKINNYLRIFAIIWVFMISIVSYRLLYLGSIGNIISFSYNYYTGILPAILVALAALDIFFYLDYLKSKITHKHMKSNLALWILLVVMLSLYVFILPFFPPNIEPNIFKIFSYPMIFIITIIPFIVSLAIPIYLLVNSRGRVRTYMQ